MAEQQEMDGRGAETEILCKRLGAAEADLDAFRTAIESSKQTIRLLSAQNNRLTAELAELEGEFDRGVQVGIGRCIR